MESCKWYDVGCGASWLVDQMEAYSLWLYEQILNGLALFVEAMSVPDFLLNVQPINFPPGVAFFLDAFEVTSGLGIVTAAYTARFILRRIPVIG